MSFAESGISDLRHNDASWQNVFRSSGDERACSIPETLLAIRSPERRVREKAWDTLFLLLAWGGGKFEHFVPKWALAIAPVLLEMARDPHVPDRGKVIWLLVEMGVSRAARRDELLRIGCSLARLRRSYARDSSQRTVEKSARLSVYKLLLEHADVVIKALTDSDARTRLLAASAVPYLLDARDRFRPVLRRTWIHETDLVAKAAMIYALSFVGPLNPGLLLPLLSPTVAGGVQVAAAVSLVRNVKPIPREAIETLRNRSRFALGEMWRQRVSVPKELCNNGLLIDAFWSLLSADQSARHTIVKSELRRWVAGQHRYKLPSYYLQLAFGPPPEHPPRTPPRRRLVSAAELTNTERLVLETLLARATPWEHLASDVLAELKRWGLPDDRERLRDFLGPIWPWRAVLDEEGPDDVSSTSPPMSAPPTGPCSLPEAPRGGRLVRSGAR